MKQIAKAGLGDGQAVLDIDAGMLEVKIQYPVAKLLEPLKANVIDKLKAAIPGTWDDGILDSLWESIVKALSETP